MRWLCPQRSHFTRIRPVPSSMPSTVHSWPQHRKHFQLAGMSISIEVSLLVCCSFVEFVCFRRIWELAETTTGLAWATVFFDPERAETVAAPAGAHQYFFPSWLLCWPL